MHTSGTIFLHRNQTNCMASNTNINNTVFGYTITGVLLFLAAIVILFVDRSNLAMHKLSYAAVPFALGSASFSLLYKAIKHDKHRLKAGLK